MRIKNLLSNKNSKWTLEKMKRVQLDDMDHMKKKFLITGIGINIIKNPNIKNYPATNLKEVAKKSINKLQVENKLKHIFEKNL